MLSKPIKIAFKVFAWVTGTLLLLLVALVVLIRLPAVQNYITQKAVAVVSSKTHTRIELRRLYIAFPKSVVIEGLFAEDLNHDTLLQVQQLEVDLDMLALLNKKVVLNKVVLTGAQANIIRGEADSSYNFDFIINAFGSRDGNKVEVKDRADSGWTVQVKNLLLENIRASFIDSVGGTEIRGAIGKLDLGMRDMAIKPLKFEGKNLLLQDANVNIVQGKVGGKETPDTAIVLMPLLALDELALQRVGFMYENRVSGMLIAVDAGDALLKPEEIDLNKQIVKVREIYISKTNTTIALRKGETGEGEEVNTDTASAGADWRVMAGKLSLKEVGFKLDFTNIPRLQEGVDYNHLALSNVFIDVDSVSYSKDKILAHIRNISLREQSGFYLKKLTARAEYDDTHAELRNLSVITNNTQINDYASVSYPSINSIAENVAELKIDANFKDTRLAVDDILLFAPMLKSQALFANNKGRIILVSGNVKGKIKDVTATNLAVGIGEHTRVALNAHIVGLPDALAAYYDVDLKTLQTTKTDLHELLSDVLPSAINIPDKILLSGVAKGSLKDASANLTLKSSSGNVQIDANLKMENTDTVYTLKLNSEALDVGYILKKEKLIGPVTLTAFASGKNFSLSNISGDAQVDVASVVFNKYEYSNIALKASAAKGKYAADITVNDSALVLALQAQASLEKDSGFIKANVDLRGADLQRLNLLKDNVRISARANADFKGGFEQLNGNASINTVTIIKNDETFRIDSIVAVALSDTQLTSFKLNSDFVNLEYGGNVMLPKLAVTITKHINKYFRILPDTGVAAVDSMQRFKLTARVSPHPIVSRVLLPDLKKFNGAEATIVFDGTKSMLDMDVTASTFAYAGITVENAAVKVISDETKMGYTASVYRLNTGPVKLTETRLSGKLQDSEAQFELKVFQEDTASKLLVSADLKQAETKDYMLHLNKGNVTLNNEKWQLPDDNFIRFGRDGFFVNNLELRNNDQLFSVKSQTDEKKTMKMVFNKFELSTLSRIIEDDTALVRGTLDGTVDLMKINGPPAFVGDLQITNVHYKEATIGDVQLKANSLTANKYVAELLLSGADNSVKANGYYAASGGNNQLDFKVNIGRLNMASIEPFTAGQLRRCSGYLQGDLTVSGTAKQPVINGDVSFKNAAFNVAYINNYLTLKDERISIDGKGIYFRSFDILDSLGQKASIDGAVYTSDFKKMQFDATIKTQNFTVINTTIRDNPLYFGTLILSSTIKVRGTEQLPKVTADAKLIDGSNISVVIPTLQISVDRGEGVVVLVDTAATYDVMVIHDSIPVAAQFKGINLTANIEVTRNTQFKLIVDKISGDSLVVKGEGLLSFSMDENGRQNLTGRYTVYDGGYKATFQKIIKRELKIQPGGTITWNGSVTDAEVDITAIYRVRTSPADLLASEITGSTNDEKAAYRKPMFFNVLMYMRGELLKPEISFALDMSESDKNAYGGAVYAKVSSLNNDPSELNKQVFALLVMNRFLPSGVGGGGGGIETAASNLARNSVNKILTDQLNSLSGKYIKGVDLNVGITANDEYSASGVQQNTQFSVGLKKGFFNDRFTVQVGTSINVENNTGAVSGADANNLTGDIVLEYKINADGTLRFKAFRENQYEGIIDGSLYKTGVGVIFNKDYDKPKELLPRNLKKDRQAHKKAAQELKEKNKSE